MLGLLIGACLLLFTACSLFAASPGPSAVGQGLKYRTGKHDFDQFFAALHAWQVKLAQAPDRERAIRARLAEQLELKDGATPGLLSTDVERRARKLSSSGIRTRLDVEGYEAEDVLDVSATLHVSGPELSGGARRAAESVVLASRQELWLMAGLRNDANQLEKQLALSALLEDQIDDAFRTAGPSKAAEVRKNLSDARKIIPLMVSRARELADEARKLVRSLERAIGTDTSPASTEPPLIVADASEAPAAEKKTDATRPAKRRGRSPVAKKNGTAPAPAAPSAAKSASPKPVDFEP